MTGVWRGSLKYICIGVFWILVWEAVYLAVGRDLVVPSPAAAAVSLWNLLWTPKFYLDVGATMARVIAGIALSFLAGLVTSVLAYFIPPLRELFHVPLGALKSTPVMAVVLFAILWLTAGLVPVFVCFLVCYPICYTNLLSGMNRVKGEYLELCRVFCVRRRDQLLSIFLPGIRPEVCSALSLVSGLAWKSAVAAEVLSVARYSMGYQLMLAKSYLETDQLFAWTIAIVLLAMAFEWIVKRLLQRKAGAG